LYEGGSTDMSNEQHSAFVNVGQQVSRTIQLEASYHASSRGAVQSGLNYNGLAHGFTLGLRKSQPISRTRTLAVAVGGGAELIDTGGTKRYWQPTYNASIETDIARTWVVSANYLRTSAMLYSPLSTPDSYVTQSALISLGGDLFTNVDLAVNLGASRGEVAAVNSLTGIPGRYTGLNSSVQVSIRMMAGLSAVVSANYYQSELNGAAKQLLLSADNFQRVSVRTGFTWNVPLLNPGRGRRAPRGR
jgi:hypothetical protein